MRFDRFRTKDNDLQQGSGQGSNGALEMRPLRRRRVFQSSRPHANFAASCQLGRRLAAGIQVAGHTSSATFIIMLS